MVCARRARHGVTRQEASALEKKQTARSAVCRAVQSAALAAELTAAADAAFALGDGLPRAAFWLLFAVLTAAFFAWRGFTRKARRIAFFSVAAATVLTAAAFFFAWKGAAPKTAYEAPETKAAFSDKRVLVVVPHEDDDLNLMAGTLETLTGENEVYVLFLSSGDVGAWGETRVNEALSALSLTGVPEENVIFLGYGDNIPDGGMHIYNAAPGELVPSASGAVLTHAAPNHPAYREGTAYTRENLVSDLRGALEEIHADVIFCSDYDEHIDHRALSLFFDEALGRLLTAVPDYNPLVLKGFAYSTAYNAPADFYESVNLLSTVCPGEERMENGVFCWKDRVRLPVDDAGLSRSLRACRDFAAAQCYESQTLQSYAQRIINGDKVFWQRCTGSLLYGAAVRVSSGNGAELNDFRLLHSPDLAGNAPPYDAVWIPERGDTAKEAEFAFSSADLTEIRLYDNPSPEDNVLAAEIIFPNGHRYETGRIDPAGTAVSVSEPDCGSFTVRLLKTEGERAGLTEIEAYTGEHDALPPLVKLTDAGGNFVYDYRLPGGETEALLSLYALGASGDIADYTVSCEGEGCSVSVADGTLRVSCPRGSECTVTVTDTASAVSDSVHIAHETAAVRLVSTLEEYAAHGIRRTNLFSLARAVRAAVLSL